VAVRSDRGIAAPIDLDGKRVGLDTPRNTAGLGMRGILAEPAGVDPASIER
jgi:TRAP-type uncharacterized transport system substrate-binding protein